MFKKLSLTLLLVSMLATAFSSERSDALFSRDANLALDNILEEKVKLETNKEDLLKIDRKIRTTKKGQAVYVELRNIAGSMVLVGIVIASYKAHFPPGLRAMLSSYITLNGLKHGMIKLSANDISKLSAGITRVQGLMTNYERQLMIQKMYYCKQEPRHLACY